MVENFLFSSIINLRRPVLFITGTDTGVGKSITCAILALYYKSLGKKVAILKPIQSGFPKDTDFLSELTGSQIPIFNTYTFSLGAAPVVACKHEKKAIDIEKVISCIRQLEKDFDVVIVEGIGGIAVPITEIRDQRLESSKSYNYLVADLIKELDYPVIIVARPTSGTINHTVLTIEFAKQKRLNILGFVVSGYDKNTKDPVMKTAPEVISKITNVPCLFQVPKFNSVKFEEIRDFSLSSKTPISLAKEYPIVL